MDRRAGYGGTSFSPPPYQLLFFLFIVLFLLFIPWYMTYETTLEDSMYDLKLVLLIIPVILLLAVRWLSVGKPMASGLLPRVEPDAIHRAGSSPWGVGLLVLLLLLMISYQSAFHDQWFPLWTRD